MPNTISLPDPAAAHRRLGFTPITACRYDQRFSYGLYVPPSHAAQPERPLRLLVAVHGTGRNIHAYLTAFREFADAHHCMVLCPLFPGSITAPWELSSYKFVRTGTLCYDEILLAMVAEVAASYPLRHESFLLFGFSGGAHFAHRFLYLHPQRLAGVAVDAPGIVTLLDPAHDWPAGVRDVATRFGIELDLDAIRRVPVLLIVGADDTETWEISVHPGSPWWVAGAPDQGADRIERLATLARDLTRAGLEVQHVVVPGKAHEMLAPPAIEFFRSLLMRTPS